MIDKRSSSSILGKRFLNPRRGSNQQPIYILETRFQNISHYNINIYIVASAQVAHMSTLHLSSPSKH